MIDSDWVEITYFKPEEFRCKCYRECAQKDANLMDKGLVKMLDRMRGWIGKPIAITSGLRCTFQNQFTNGSNQSSHMTGQGVDIHCAGISLDQAFLLAEKVGFAGIISYPYDHHLHVDTQFGLGYTRGIKRTASEKIIFVLSQRAHLPEGVLS